MKVSKIALEKINTPMARIKLAAGLGVTEQSIIGYIKDNKDDGNLTKATAMKIIRDVTGLEDSQILIEATVKA